MLAETLECSCEWRSKPIRGERRHVNASTQGLARPPSDQLGDLVFRPAPIGFLGLVGELGRCCWMVLARHRMCGWPAL
jgi:hypothetical protein